MEVVEENCFVNYDESLHTTEKVMCNFVDLSNAEYISVNDKKIW